MLAESSFKKKNLRKETGLNGGPSFWGRWVEPMAPSCPWTPVSLGSLPAGQFPFGHKPQPPLSTGSEVALLLSCCACSATGRISSEKKKSHKIQNQLMSALQGILATIWFKLVRSLVESLGPQLAKCQGNELLENPDLRPVAKIPLPWEHL